MDTLRKVTRRRAQGRGGTNQEHNVQGVRTDLEDDYFWKALIRYKQRDKQGTLEFSKDQDARRSLNRSSIITLLGEFQPGHCLDSVELLCSKYPNKQVGAKQVYWLCQFGEVICHEQAIMTAVIEIGARAEVSAIENEYRAKTSVFFVKSLSMPLL